MVRAFEAELLGLTDDAIGVKSGFFQSVDGAPAEGYRGPRENLLDRTWRENAVGPTTFSRPVAILTGQYGAQVLGPLVERLGRDGVRVVPVRNEFFGGNIAVTGLLVGEDLARTLAGEPEGDRYLLPDVCLSNGTFLDGTRPEDLPRPVEVVKTDGVSLRRALA
jgi:hypothetical protein